MPRPQRPDPARAPLRLLAVALLGVATALAAEPPRPDADLDGRWLGTAGSERDRVVFGVEIARGEEGATELRLTLPVAHFHGLPAWGEVRREGARLEVEALGLELELVDGRLVGSFPEPGSPVALERVVELPAAAPWPDLPAGPEPIWRAQLGAPVFASPVVADGVVYVGTTGGLMLAVDASEGGLAWAFRAGRPIHGAALVAGDALYFVCDDGHLYKLARADGAELWRYDLGDARVPRIPPHPQVFDWDWQAPTPALADGLVYVGSGDGSFHAVEAATGARRWRFETGGRVRNGAAIDGARVLVGSADHHVYALDRASGRELWRHDTGGEIDAAPVVVGERVLVAARGAGLRALAVATGETLWSHPFWTSWVESTPVVADGVAYVGSSDLRCVTALDPADGRVLWRTDVGGWSWGTPLVAGDRVWAAAAAGNPYFVEHRAGLGALDRATGRPLWRHPLDEPEGAFLWGITGSPVRAGDRVIVATAQGTLLAFPMN
ncbi:MAG TPA: PQQ-binding-like beta-propeller repeat protein [Thermoanaerobaculia bacterium]|nr:PQQ-binding-like beta-propeller repeat protein [Thermoanaerobaculia bacterium]